MSLQASLLSCTTLLSLLPPHSVMSQHLRGPPNQVNRNADTNAASSSKPNHNTGMNTRMSTSAPANVTAAPLGGRMRAPIPDLRLETTFLRSARPYIKDGNIAWLGVIWVITRDTALSPFMW
jgi:hypothetical protein